MTPRPVFVIGSPRSGTSILTWCLGQHPNLLPLEETVWMAKLASDLARAYAIGVRRGDRSQLSAMGIPKGPFCEAFGAAIDELILAHRPVPEAPIGPEVLFAKARSPDDPKRRWVDGTPENSFYVYDLLQLFPLAKFVHLVRDPEDVARSLLHFHKVGGRRYTVVEAYSKWAEVVDRCIEAERGFGSEVVSRLRYRDFIDTPVDALRETIARVGEEFHPDCVLPLARKINSSGRTDDGEGRIEALDAELAGKVTALRELALESPSFPSPDERSRARVEARAGKRSGLMEQDHVNLRMAR